MSTSNSSNSSNKTTLLKSKKGADKSPKFEDGEHSNIHKIIGLFDRNKKLMHHNHHQTPMTHKTNTTTNANNTNGGGGGGESTVNDDLNEFNSQKHVDKRRNLADEYLKMEEKQANLCLALSKVYDKISNENTKQKLCEPDDLSKVFSSIIDLKQVAESVHQSIANDLKERVEKWSKTSVIADIILIYIHFYKVYKPILQSYQRTREALADLIKKKEKFASYLTKCMKEEPNLAMMPRLDIHLDQIVSLPRRSHQLLETYLKHIDKNSKEYADIKKIIEILVDIFGTVDETLYKMTNFQDCYKLQYMIEPQIDLVGTDIQYNSREIIKQGELNKISRKNGDHLPRYVALLNDMLLICGIDRLKKKYILKYQVKVNTIAIIENSDPTNELIFRIISPEQNNEFVAEDAKDKESWLKAFRKINEIKFDSTVSNVDQIGNVAPMWIKDNLQTQCTICKATFTTIRRRHHCRTCGKIFCGSCCDLTIPVKFDNFRSKQRVCKICYVILEKVYNEHLAANGGGGIQHSESGSSFVPNGGGGGGGATVTASNTGSNIFRNANTKILEIFSGSRHTVDSQSTLSTTSTATLVPSSSMSPPTSPPSQLPPVPIITSTTQAEQHMPVAAKLNNEAFLTELKNKQNHKNKNHLNGANGTTNDQQHQQQQQPTQKPNKIQNNSPNMHNNNASNDQRSSCNDTSSTTTENNEDEILSSDESDVDDDCKSIVSKDSGIKVIVEQRKQQADNDKSNIRNIKTRRTLVAGSKMSQVLFADWLLVCKYRRQSILDTDEEATTATVKSTTNKWQRQFLILYDDLSVAMFNTDKDVQPNNIIYLETFDSLVNESDESIIELKKKEKSTTTTFKTRLNLFEFTNFELKFLNQELKQKFFNLINSTNEQTDDSKL